MACKKYIYILYYLIIHDIVPHFNLKKKNLYARYKVCVPFRNNIYTYSILQNTHTCLPLNVYELAILSLNETWILPAPTATGLSPAKTKRAAPQKPRKLENWVMYRKVKYSNVR